MQTLTGRYLQASQRCGLPRSSWVVSAPKIAVQLPKHCFFAADSRTSAGITACTSIGTKSGISTSGSLAPSASPLERGSKNLLPTICKALAVSIAIMVVSHLVPATATAAAAHAAGNEASNSALSGKRRLVP